MKAKTAANRKPKPMRPQFISVAGRRAVVLEEAEYHRLVAMAKGELPLPKPDKDGNYPADEALAALVAGKLMRRRRAAGLTQVELARRAGIRPETLNRLEHGRHAPAPETVDRIEQALAQAEADESQEQP